MKTFPSDWIDVSVPLRTGMVHWPDNPPVRIERLQDMERGYSANVSVFSLGSHTGTHMDAPLHFVRTGLGLDEMPFSAVIGPARIIEIQDPESIKEEELVFHDIRRDERILFKTRNSSRCWETDEFLEDFVYISQEAALHLVTRGVQTVGVDYLSSGDLKKDGPETHHVLLESGVWIIEGLNLGGLAPGSYDLICLPLRVERSDGTGPRDPASDCSRGSTVTVNDTRRRLTNIALIRATALVGSPILRSLENGTRGADFLTERKIQGRVMFRCMPDLVEPLLQCDSPPAFSLRVSPQFYGGGT